MSQLNELAAKLIREKLASHPADVHVYQGVGGPSFDKAYSTQEEGTFMVPTRFTPNGKAFEVRRYSGKNAGALLFELNFTDDDFVVEIHATKLRTVITLKGIVVILVNAETRSFTNSERRYSSWDYYKAVINFVRTAEWKKDGDNAETMRDLAIAFYKDLTLEKWNKYTIEMGYELK